MKDSKIKVRGRGVWPYAPTKFRLCLLILLLLPLSACTPSKQDSPTAPSGGELPGGAEVSVASETVSGPTFTVKVYVDNVSDLYDAGFVMSYNSAVATPTTTDLKTTSWALAQDGTSNMNYSLTNNQPSTGQFMVSVTRIGYTLSGVNVTSKTLLCEIEFQKVAAGNLNLSFVTGGSTYLQHTTLNDFVSGVTWTNGTITVQ